MDLPKYSQKPNKSRTLKSLIRKDLAEYTEYAPVLSAEDRAMQQGVSLAEICKLDANENPYGPSPRVQEVLGSFTGYHYYPDPTYKQLRSALSAYTDTPIDQIIVGNGADELIDLISRLCLDPTDSIIDCPPTFSSYSLAARLSHGRVIQVPRDSAYQVNTSDILKSLNDSTKIIYICNPNNPTGTGTTPEQLEPLLQTGLIVVVDEAYYEYSQVSAQHYLRSYPNLVILRTLSKWAGLAGLRLGYALSSPEFISLLAKIKPPYNVNYAADLAGRAALSDLGWYKDKIATLIQERENRFKQLSRISQLKVYPSSANYLFLKVPELRNLMKQMEKQGIYLRYYSSPLTGDAVRVTIGRPEQNREVQLAFSQFYG